jgi:hypothetical protein
MGILVLVSTDIAGSPSQSDSLSFAFLISHRPKRFPLLAATAACITMAKLALAFLLLVAVAASASIAGEGEWRRASSKAHRMAAVLASNGGA